MRRVHRVTILLALVAVAAVACGQDKSPNVDSTSVPSPTVVATSEPSPTMTATRELSPTPEMAMATVTRPVPSPTESTTVSSRGNDCIWAHEPFTEEVNRRLYPYRQQISSTGAWFVEADCSQNPAVNHGLVAILTSDEETCDLDNCSSTLLNGIRLPGVEHWGFIVSKPLWRHWLCPIHGGSLDYTIRVARTDPDYWCHRIDPIGPTPTPPPPPPPAPTPCPGSTLDPDHGPVGTVMHFESHCLQPGTPLVSIHVTPQFAMSTGTFELQCPLASANEKGILVVDCAMPASVEAPTPYVLQPGPYMVSFCIGEGCRVITEPIFTVTP